MALLALAHVGDFFSHARRGITVHQVAVAFLGDQLLGGFGFPTGVDRWPWLQDVIVHAVVLAYVNVDSALRSSSSP